MYEKYELWEPGRVPLYIEAFGGEAPYVETALVETGKNNPVVVVVPGGAYVGVSKFNEGYPICALLNAAGYSAVMLTYRVSVPRAAVLALDDLAKAVGWLEEHAKDPASGALRYAIGGYSAGANLVSNWGCASIGWKRCGRKPWKADS